MKRVIILFFGIFGCPIAIVNARDLGQWEAVNPEIRGWYQALMQPDVPNASCCGEADAYWADEVHVRDGKTYATITDDRPDEPRGRAARRHRNGNRNSEQQTQMGQIESNRPRSRILEPHRLCILLRTARRCLIEYRAHKPEFVRTVMQDH
jgi:hypothetical protein